MPTKKEVKLPAEDADQADQPHDSADQKTRKRRLGDVYECCTDPDCPAKKVEIGIPGMLIFIQTAPAAKQMPPKN